MKAHLEYLWYVVRHKWFVYVAGRKTGAPLWRLLIHDWSKFSPAEWTPYVRSFYGPQPRSEETKLAFKKAWLHHQHNNAHHWQHWVLREDDGDTIALLMPYDLAREMLADWMGAGRAITGKWEVQEWYEKNASKILLHPDTRQFVEKLMRAVSQ